MPTGKFKSYFADKGWGFIGADDGSPDLHAHAKGNLDGNAASVREGMRVEYDTEWDASKSKMRAKTWKLLDPVAPGGACGGGCGGMQFGSPGCGGMPHQQFGMPAGCGGMAPQQNFGMPQQNFGMPQQQPHYGMMQQQPQYGMMPQQPQYGMMQQQPQYGIPPQQPAQQPCFSGPQQPMQPQNYGMPHQQQPAYGAVQTQQAHGADRSSPYGAGAGGCGGACGSSANSEAAQSALPAGWESAADPSSGKPYYFNRSSGETKWDPPTAAPAAAPVAAAAPVTELAVAAATAPVEATTVSTPAPVTSPEGAALPQGWESAADPSSGKPYYFNRTTNETRWDIPT